MECRRSIAKIGALLLLGAGMIAASWFCTTIDKPFARIAGWSGLVFFGLCFVAIALMAFQRTPQVVISEDGIDDRRWKLGVVPWDDVRDMSMRSMGNNRFICVELVDPEKYLGNLSWWQRKLMRANTAVGFPGLVVNCTGLSPGVDEVWAHLQSRAA